MTVNSDMNNFSLRPLAVNVMMECLKLKKTLWNFVITITMNLRKMDLLNYLKDTFHITFFETKSVPSFNLLFWYHLCHGLVIWQEFYEVA